MNRNANVEDGYRRMIRESYSGTAVPRVPYAADVVLEASGGTKRYQHVVALRGADLTVRAGEVLGLIGNGSAERCTRVKVLCGLSGPDASEVRVAGLTATFGSPAEGGRDRIRSNEPGAAESALVDLAISSARGLT